MNAMIILISGASHVGKTALAQRLLEAYGFPYLSIDHLKMGLIRSGQTQLTPLSDDGDLTAYLWPIVCEMVKTAIENRQNLVVEGCYIPVDWEKDFDEGYRQHIRTVFLVMSEGYVRNCFADICNYANVIEQRLCDDLVMEEVVEENRAVLAAVESRSVPYVLIENAYESTIEALLREGVLALDKMPQI